MSSNYQQNALPQNDYLEYSDPFAALAKADERSAFIAKTYMNLAAAIFGLVILEIALFQIPGVGQLAELIRKSSASICVISVYLR